MQFDMCFIVVVGSLCLCFFFSIFCLLMLFVGYVFVYFSCLFFLLFFYPARVPGRCPVPRLTGGSVFVVFTPACVVWVGWCVLRGWRVNVVSWLPACGGVGLAVVACDGTIYM